MPRNNWRGAQEWILGSAADGSEVVVRQNTNHLAGVDSLLIVEAIEAIEAERLPKSGLATFSHNFGEQVGWADIVETRREDLVFYAPRTDASGGPRRDARTNKIRFTRWVERVEKPKAYEITLGLLRPQGVTQLVVIFAAFGPPMRLEPGDPRTTDEDRLWWSDPNTGRGHAFVTPFQHFGASKSIPEDFEIR